MIKTTYYNSPYGELILGDYKGKLCLCDWRYRKMRKTIDKRISKMLDSSYSMENTVTINETINQLNEYFSSERREFDLPIMMVGSDFQIRVWEELQLIAFGSTVTYSELSEGLGDPLAIRAVASANGANALAIIIPCHRVIGSDGKLTGYAGGLDTKKKLLQLEGSYPSYGQQELNL